MAADPAEDAVVDGAVVVAEGDVLDGEVPDQLRALLAPLHVLHADAHRVDVHRHLVVGGGVGVGGGGWWWMVVLVLVLLALVLVVDGGGVVDGVGVGGGWWWCC